MKKKISAALLALAGLSAVSSAAFADGPVGRAINGAVRAGEDIVDGVGDAADDVVGGVADGVDDITGDDDDVTLDPGATDEPPASNDSIVTDSSDIVSDSVSSSEPVSSTDSGSVSINNGGAVGGINTTNPGTGVTYGLSAAAAVLAAVGVAVTAVRKNK